MTKSCFMIDSAKLDREIKTQGLKLWWLAEQLKVDRKTITRWLHGKVKWIREDNLQALARILNCSTDALLRSEGMPLYTTTADQNLAAQSISAHGFLRLLAPSGHFDLAETLIKGLLGPNLPLRTLASLYIDLAHCCWQQNKLDEAEGYADLVLGLHERLEDPLLHLKARQHLVSIHARRGDLRQALELADICFPDPALLQDPCTHAQILFDLSEVMGHAGADWDKVKLLREESRKMRSECGSPCELQAARDALSMAYFLADQDRLDEAEHACRQARTLAHATQFRQGMARAQLIQAEIDSRRGYHEDAMAAFASCYPNLVHGDVGLYEALGAALYRRAGYYEEALFYANRGLTSHNPLFRARCYEETARIQTLLGNIPLARRHQRAAHDLYLLAGARNERQTVVAVPHAFAL